MPAMPRRSPQSDTPLKEGSVAWCRALVDSFESHRDKTVGKWWESVDSLFFRRTFDRNRIDHDYLVDTCVEPPRVNQIVNLAVSTVFNQRPRFEAHPATVYYEDFAGFAEEAMNNDWRREYATMREIKLCAQDCVTKGIGIAYTISEEDFGAATRARRKKLSLAKKVKTDVALGLTGLDDYPTNEANMEWAETGVENNDLARAGRIGTRRIDPWRFGFDWTAQSEHDSRFFWRWYYATKDSIKRQEYWSATAKRQLEYAALDESLFIQSVEGDPREWVRIYEGWFKDAEGKFNLKVWWDGAGENDSFLYEAESPLEHGHPYRLLRWNESGSTIWCPSDVLIVYQSIVMERHVQTRMYDQMMRQACDVTLVDGEVLNEDDVSPMEVDGVGLLLRLSGLNGRPINTVFDKLKKDPIGQESMAYLALLERQIQDGLGLGQNQMLQYGKSETSATEAAQVARWADARGALRHAAMREFVAGVAHDRLKCLVRFGDPSEVRALASPTTARLLQFNTFTAGDVQYGLHVSVVEGSMEAPTQDERTVALQTVLTLILQGQPIAGMLCNAPAIFLEWLKMLGIKEGSNLLMPGVTAEAIQQTAQQMALSQGGQGGSPPGVAGRSNAAGISRVPAGAA
jgi:hypothetical protein